MSTSTATKPATPPWLDHIPDQWQVASLKKLVQRARPITYGIVQAGPKLDEGVPYIRPVDMTDEGIPGADELPKTTEEIAAAYARSSVIAGDLVVTIGPSFGKVAFVPEGLDGANLTQGTARVAIDSERIFPRYAFWVLRSGSTHDYWGSRSSGATFSALNLEPLAETPIPYPPLPTQRAIAAYLDSRTARIDALVARKQRLVQLLKEKRQALITRAVTRGLDPKVKLKESGVPWLGRVPEHWGVKRFKHVVSVWGRIGFRGYTTDDLVDEGEGALAIGASHITEKGGIDVSDPVFLSWPKYYESPEIMVRQGDLIVVQRGSVGKVALVDRDLGPATINPSLILLKDAKAHPRFLLYVLLGGYIQSTITTLLSATAVPMISQEQVGNFDLLLPPPAEQKTIVEFLDRQTSRLDTLIRKVEQAVLRLQEYRTALISAAVTGRVRVGRG